MLLDNDHTVPPSNYIVIEVCQLSAVFQNGDGGLQALDQLSFSVHDQEFLCVLGPSGSGKSTLLRILAGLLPPTAGDVFYRGERLSGPKEGTACLNFSHS